MILPRRPVVDNGFPPNTAYNFRCTALSEGTTTPESAEARGKFHFGDSSSWIPPDPPPKKKRGGDRGENQNGFSLCPFLLLLESFSVSIPGSCPPSTLPASGSRQLVLLLESGYMVGL